jgi:hypothetical protein
MRRTRGKVEIGGRYGRLVVLGLAWKAANGNHYFCKCDCGEETVVAGSSLCGDLTKSCGCLRRERTARMGKANLKHGHKSGENRPNGTKTYRCWKAMLDRCFNPNTTAYEHYGGREITVCDRWLVFENFLEDMGEAPPRLQIDRIDNDGDYEPGNCRWVDASTNLKNRRRKVI